MKKSIIACLAVATCSLGLGAQTPALAADYGRITVEGHAETTYVANQSMVVATVETKGTSIQAAKASNDSQFMAFRQSLRDLAIPDKDLRTSDYQSYDEDYYPTKDSDVKATRYVVSNTLKVTLNDTSKIAAVLDAAAKAGITDVRLTKLDLNPADKEAQKNDLMVKAAKDARKKADALAAALGTRVVGVASLDVDGDGYRPYYGARLMMAKEANSAAPVIENGEDTATMNVSVVFKVK